MSCFSATLLNVAGPLVFTLQYNTHFFLDDTWTSNPEVEPVAFVLVVLSLIEIGMSVANVAYKLVKYPQEWYKIKGDPWIYTIYSYVFSDLWQAMLKFMIILIIFTHLSGSAMAFIFFHTVMEGYLAILRLMTVLKAETSFMGTYIAVVLYGLAGILMMLTEDTISKGIITGVLAVPADLLNVVLTPWLVHRARTEKQPSYNMPLVTHWFHLLLAYGHLLLFYVQLIIVCYVSPLTSAFAVLGLFFLNFMIRVFGLVMIPIPSHVDSLDSDTLRQAIGMEEGLGGGK